MVFSLPLLQSHIPTSALSSLRQPSVILVLAIGHSSAEKALCWTACCQRTGKSSDRCKWKICVFISTESVNIGDNNVILMGMASTLKTQSRLRSSLCVVSCLQWSSGLSRKDRLMKNLNQLLEVNQWKAIEGQWVAVSSSLGLRAQVCTGHLRIDDNNFQKGQFSQKTKFITRGMNGISAQATEEIKREILQMPSFL